MAKVRYPFEENLMHIGRRLRSLYLLLQLQQQSQQQTLLQNVSLHLHY